MLNRLLPSNLWNTWNWNPHILLVLSLGAVVYSWSLASLVQKGRTQGRIRPRQVFAFGSALAAIFIALASPLDALGLSLFSAHILQYLILALVAAPLLVLSSPLYVFRSALPPFMHTAWRKVLDVPILFRLWNSLTHPLFVWILNAAVLWIWHLPAVYQASLEYEFMRNFGQAILLASAVLYWWVLFSSDGRKRMAFGPSMLYILMTLLVSSGFGVLLTLTAQPWYTKYNLTTPLWGITPLYDQQVAGLMMWVPTAAIYLTAAAVLFLMWLNGVEQAVRENDLAQMHNQAIHPALKLTRPAVVPASTPVRWHSTGDYEQNTPVQSPRARDE